MEEVVGQRECPQPDKTPFTEDDVKVHVQVMRREPWIPPLRSYHCVCDAWHVTKHPKPPVPHPNLPVSELAVWAAALPDDLFGELVEGELRGVADRPVLEVLTHWRIASRWQATLRTLQKQANDAIEKLAKRQDLPARSNRRKLSERQLLLSARLGEAKEAVSNASMHPEFIAERHRRSVERKRAKIGLARARFLAGKRALNRLVQAHREEFDDLFREEVAWYTQDQAPEAAEGP